MKVQVEAATEPLKVVDRGVLAARDVGGPALLPGDSFDEDAAERTRDVGAEGSELAELERQREHPLAHRDRGEDAIDEVRGGVRHAASSAARADASALATEGDEEIPATVVAVESQEAVSEDAAREVVEERLLDVARQSARVVLPGVIEEGLEMIAHDRVEDGVGRAARDVGRGGGSGARSASDGRYGSGAREHGAARFAISVPIAGPTISTAWPVTRVAAATFRHGAASSQRSSADAAGSTRSRESAARAPAAVHSALQLAPLIRGKYQTEHTRKCSVSFWNHRARATNLR
ncbi:MAG: hypothetical protein QM820_40510 [Minicystis sp.]